MSILPYLLNILISTLRIKIINPVQENRRAVYIFWHSKMLIGWWLFKNKKYAALVSKSKDGELLSGVLKKWNYMLVRGSSSKGGKEALAILNDAVRENNSAVITPDGPRGPAGEIKNGVFIISNECGIPIIPVKVIYHKKKILTKSWDNFEIPLPFSRCDVYFGNEYRYEKYLDDDELNSLKKKISNEM